VLLVVVVIVAIVVIALSVITRDPRGVALKVKLSKTSEQVIVLNLPSLFAVLSLSAGTLSAGSAGL
jgi:hypothetical protein